MHSDLATLHPNHLGEPDTPCTVRFFEIRISSFTVLMIPLSFAHHIPVNHHSIPHLVHHAYSLALQLDATHTLIDKSHPHNVHNPPCGKTIYNADLIF